MRFMHGAGWQASILIDMSVRLSFLAALGMGVVALDFLIEKRAGPRRATLAQLALCTLYTEDHIRQAVSPGAFHSSKTGR